MIKKLALLCIIPLFFAAHLMGAGVNGVPEKVLRSVYGHYVFNGDRHGDFVGNYVIVLNDGSEWKVHPDDTNKFSRWEINDIVHTKVRTSFYWFKREHKFELFNHTRNEAVKVMLVNYPIEPMTIRDVRIDTKYYVQEHQNGTRTVDIIYTYNVLLSDRSLWTIKDRGQALNLLKVGRFVYLGLKHKANTYSYFFILGTEREAKWYESGNGLNFQGR